MLFQKNEIEFGDYEIESHNGMELSGSEVGNESFETVQALKREIVVRHQSLMKTPNCYDPRIRGL